MPVYVAPSGSDNNTGTSDNPFKSFAKACECARAFEAGKQKTITVRGGLYYDADLALTPADSGMTIEAAPGERPVLYGGHPVTSWPACPSAQRGTLYPPDAIQRRMD